VSEQRARRAAKDGSASNAAVRPEPQQIPWQAPSTFVDGIKDVVRARADNVLDWYAAQSRTLRLGLLGGLGAFCLMGVVAAASSALTPTPVTSWANVPSSSATSMSVRVSGSAGPVASTSVPSASDSSSAQLPSVTETAATSANPTTTTTATTKPTSATTQKTTAAPTQTQAPVHTTDPTTAAPTTSEPTTAPPTTDPPTTDPPTTDPPTTDPPTTDPPTTDPPTTDPTE
jgi:hypothetical protein